MSPSRFKYIISRTKYRNKFPKFTSRSQVPQPGKLRVRCSVCREGAVVVVSDPCSWEDVLQPARIKGYCQNGLCAGNDSTEG